MRLPAFATPSCVSFRSAVRYRTNIGRTQPLPVHSSRVSRCSRITRAELEQPEEPREPVETTLIPEAEALNPELSTTIPPTYNLAGALTFLGGLMFYKGDAWLLPGFPVLILGLFLWLQTVRVRFIFGPTRLSVAKTASEGAEIIRGWAYDQITNWELWWPKFPVLAYFKESESYAGRGSIHFFPILCDGVAVRRELDGLLERLGKGEQNALTTLLQAHPHMVYSIGACNVFPRERARRFQNAETSKLFVELFRQAGDILKCELSRYDLHHGHMIYYGEGQKLGVLFHGKEYPAKWDGFPYELGYCQRGSDLVVEEADMRFRSVLWGMDGFWLLDGSGRMPFGTFYESEFGEVLADIYYFDDAVNGGVHVVCYDDA